jgi:hypothetical protein
LLGRITDALATNCSAKAKLRISPELEPVSALCLGYPAAIPEAPPRKPPSIIWVN